MRLNRLCDLFRDRVNVTDNNVSATDVDPGEHPKVISPAVELSYAREDAADKP
jgi:hypothetical protein